MNTIDRLKAHTRLSTSGCWLWTGYRDRNSYGRITVDKRSRYAHRVAFTELRGPIPKGRVLAHVVCDRPACINPGHLEPVSNRANVLTGHGITARHARATHCIHGHRLAGENVYIDARGHRHCRTCRRAAVVRYRAKLAAAGKRRPDQPVRCAL